MDRAGDLLIEVWREASRHVDLAESVPLIATILARQMPIDGLAVLSIHRDDGVVTPRVTALGLPKAPAWANRLLTRTDRRALTSWVRHPVIVAVGEGLAPEPVARALLPDLPEGNWLLCPLGGSEPAGVALFRASPSRRFEPAHLALAETLLDPLGVAFENDRRFHELSRLREAAEAERRSALLRLGREDFSEAIVGAEAGLAPVMERTTLAARSDIPILILGETGTGKEVIARAIHERSHRRDKPFIRVNCGAIPAELIDSQLFGHEKGAFTGAVAMRRGWFERADEGTLLLDEIGELPLAAQTRLLRVLQEGTFERVGGEATLSANVRIVASTHRDLPGMVQNGAFRQDLWYRIAAFPIVLPPLRERRADIGPLAAHLAARAARRFGLRSLAPTEQDIALLREYDWPGNIRELASVIDRAAILGDGRRLEIGRALGASPVLSITTTASSPVSTDQPGGVVSLDDAVRSHIEAALRRTGGRIEGERGAARLLRINPHTLRARMRKLGIAWGQFRAGSTPVR